MRALSLAAGAALLVVAFGPPLERAAHESLTGHMVQHLLLTTVAAPLLVLGAPSARMLGRLPSRVRRLGGAAHRRSRTGWWPVAVLTGYTAVTWTWHLPGIYDAALANPWIHAVGHATLLGAASAFWWTVARPAAQGIGILLVFGAALQHAALASVLLFAPAPLYAHPGGLDDQRLAAVVMGTPAKLVYGLALVVLVLTWLSGLERRTTVREAHRTALRATGGAPGRR